MAGGDVGAIGVHTWSALVHERLVNFQSIKLKQQVMIWVGEEGSMGCLAAAVPVGDCPATQVIGASEQSLKLSSHLAKKLGKQVFLSFNVDDDVLFGPAVHARLMQEMKEKPDKF